MDVFTALISAVSTFWYLIPVVIIIGILKSPWFKGMTGEFMVNLSAKLFLDKQHYHLLKNVTLQQRMVQLRLIT